MPGNVDAVLFITGFAVAAACIGVLGHSLTEDHPRRIVLPITIASAVVSGALVGWAFDYFFHFAQRGPQ